MFETDEIVYERVENGIGITQDEKESDLVSPGDHRGEFPIRPHNHLLCGEGHLCRGRLERCIRISAGGNPVQLLRYPMGMPLSFLIASCFVFLSVNLD